MFVPRVTTLTLLLPKFATHMLSPSKATPSGLAPTVICVMRLALYQCRIAICSGFWVEVTTPANCALAREP